MRKLLMGMTVGAALVASAASADEGHGQNVGRAGDPKNVSRTVRITMSDAMRFTPAKIDAKRGETIRFVLVNTGKVKHEMVIGSMAELKEHAALMRKMPGMEHADDNMLTVEPGKTGELVWQFTRSGTVNFACLQPGHFEAGMLGKVRVASQSPVRKESK